MALALQDIVEANSRPVTVRPDMKALGACPSGYFLFRNNLALMIEAVCVEAAYHKILDHKNWPLALDPPALHLGLLTPGSNPENLILPPGTGYEVGEVVALIGHGEVALGGPSVGVGAKHCFELEAAVLEAAELGCIQDN